VDTTRPVRIAKLGASVAAATLAVTGIALLNGLAEAAAATCVDDPVDLTAPAAPTPSSTTSPSSKTAPASTCSTAAPPTAGAVARQRTPTPKKHPWSSSSS
jgi:hypothetical protein